MLQTSRLSRTAVHGPHTAPNELCKVFITAYDPSTPQTQRPTSIRTFHSTRFTAIREFFPEPDAPSIRTTRPAWRHPVYTEDQMKTIVVAHRESKNWSDWAAFGAVRILRWGLDLATGYKHDKHAPVEAVGGEGKKKPFAMTERKYMIR